MREVLLEVDLVVAKGDGSLRLGSGEHLLELVCALCHAHALATATGGSLDEHRVANLFGDAGRFLCGLDGAVGAGDRGNAELGHGRLGMGLVAELLDGLGARADEDDVVVGTGARELRALREETVAGVDGLCTGDLSRTDDVLDHQIGLGRGCRADADGLVGELDGQRVRVGLGVDDDGLHAELMRSADDANRDLAAVRDKDLVKHHAAPTRR